MTLFDSKDAVMDNFHFFVVLQELSSLLSMEAMSFVTEDRKTVQESSFPNTYTFDLFGGVDVSSVRACFGVLFPRHAFSLVVRSPFLFSEPREYVLKFSILPPPPPTPCALVDPKAAGGNSDATHPHDTEEETQE